MYSYCLVGLALAIGQGQGGQAPVAPTPAATAAAANAPPAQIMISAPSLANGFRAVVLTITPASCQSTESAPYTVASPAEPPAPTVFNVPLEGWQSTGATALVQPPAAADTTTQASKESKRRALPAPFPSPPLPGSEYQGYPLIGVPDDFSMWPLMKVLQGTPFNDFLVDNRTRVYGWVTVEGNASNARNSNTPDSYWIRPNTMDMDQALIRFERLPDTVQTDHVDYGFRFTGDYGIDYRYFTAGGWMSDQLLKHNQLYGWDLTECYFDVYVPWVFQGMEIRVGRWVACPDIETQFAPDNYMGSHSLLFTFDTYTQTGIMWTFKLSDQWTFQSVLHSGTDMAPWYPGALPTGAFGVRWVAQDNNDAAYVWLNAINDAKFRVFEQYNQVLGHDNFNYVVGTWEHRFNPQFMTKTEGYFMWQKDAVVGGTPSAGPPEPFGGGGGIGAFLPGWTYAFGVLNFTEFVLGKWDYITIRNEWWKDTRGERSGYANTYTSNAIGWAHFFTPDILFRPEIGYYRAWNNPAFDLGTKKNLLMAGFDLTIRF
jgi:hypothetical protein